MRNLFPVFMLMGAGLLIASGTNFAQDTKDVVLKGTVTCAKCDLKLEKKCATVIVVKGDKDVVYYFDKASNKKYHGETCTEAKKATVEGTVSEADKKKVIAVKKLTYE